MNYFRRGDLQRSSELKEDSQKLKRTPRVEYLCPRVPVEIGTGNFEKSPNYLLHSFSHSENGRHLTAVW